MRDFIHSEKLERRAHLSGMSVEFVRTLKEKNVSSVDTYEQDLDKDIFLFRRTTTHCDYHGGNIFFDAERGQASIIDYGGLTWTIAKDNHDGTGDPANDLGRLMGNILLEDIKEGTYTLKSYDKLKSFYSHYLAFSGIRTYSEEELVLRRSVNMFINRYFAIQCVDESGTKFNSQALNKLQREELLFRVWSEVNSNLLVDVPQ